MRVYGYLRLSSPATHAMEHQRGALLQYAALNGLHLAEVLVDIARPIPLPLARRDLGSRLLQRLVPGDAVITPGLDSMFPSARDAFATIARLGRSGIALHVVELGCDICREPVGGSERLGNSAGAVRSREVEESRSLKRHLASQGSYRGGPVPFGFDAVKGRLVPKTEEYHLLRRMIALRNEGFSYGRIARDVGVDESRVRGIFGRTEGLLGPGRIEIRRTRHG